MTTWPVALELVGTRAADGRTTRLDLRGDFALASLAEVDSIAIAGIFVRQFQAPTVPKVGEPAALLSALETHGSATPVALILNGQSMPTTLSYDAATRRVSLTVMMPDNVSAQGGDPINVMVPSSPSVSTVVYFEGGQSISCSVSVQSDSCDENACALTMISNCPGQEYAAELARIVGTAASESTSASLSFTLVVAGSTAQPIALGSFVPSSDLKLEVPVATTFGVSGSSQALLTFPIFVSESEGIETWSVEDGLSLLDTAPAANWCRAERDYSPDSTTGYLVTDNECRAGFEPRVTLLGLFSARCECVESAVTPEEAMRVKRAIKLDILRYVPSLLSDEFVTRKAARYWFALTWAGIFRYAPQAEEVLAELRRMIVASHDYAGSETSLDVEIEVVTGWGSNVKIRHGDMQHFAKMLEDLMMDVKSYGRVPLSESLNDLLSESALLLTRKVERVSAHAP